MVGEEGERGSLFATRGQVALRLSQNRYNVNASHRFTAAAKTDNQPTRA